MTLTAWPFVQIDEGGVAYIQGTTTKVIEIAVDEVSRRLSPVEIQQAYPYLSLPQIHAALGYYHEHLVECDRQIELGRQRAEELLEQLGDPDLQGKLRRLKTGP